MGQVSDTSRELYPNEPFLRAFEESGMSYCELARRLGWYRTIPDASKLKQVLGVTRWKRDRPHQKRVHYETALALCRALDMDPVDFGL